MAPPRRCRATGRQPAAPPAAAVWLTDMVLREAIERFQRRCFSSHRRLSSHRSPLEARCLVGRRHMAGIMPVPQQTYRLGWHFELLGNQNVWEWSPPTSAKTRRENEQKISLSRWKDSLFRWLENFDFDKPFLVPPDEAALDAEKSTTASNDSASAVADPLGVEFDTFRDKIQARRTVPEQALKQALEECFESFLSRVKLGRFDIEELPMALNPLDEMTWDHAARSLPQQTLKLLVAHHRRALLDCLDSARKAGEGVIFHKAWIKMFEEVLLSKPDMELLDLGEYILDRSTPRDAIYLRYSKVNQFLRSYIAYLARKRFTETSWILDVGRFSQTLQLVSSIPGNEWSPKFAMRSYKHRFSTSWYPKQHTVMLLMAHDSSIPEDVVSKLPVHGSHTCELITARLLGSGTMTYAAFEALTRTYTECATHSGRWLALTSTLTDRDRYGSFLDSLLSLQRLNGPTPVDVSYIVSKALTRPEDSAMHAHALRIFERLAKDPETKLYEEWVWCGLREQVEFWMEDTSHQQSVRAAAMTKLLDEVVTWYLNAPQLSERQVLRGVERCVQLQQYYSDRISQKVLASLTQVVIRDLEAGEFGRSTRLANLVQKVAMNQGIEEAKRCLKMIRNWRKMIIEAKIRGPW